MSRRNLYLCGVPEHQCSGMRLKLTSAQWVGSKKAHKTPAEAHKCMARHLLHDLNYTYVGGRGYAPPDGGPVRILTRQTHYGAKVRLGKEGARHMPEDTSKGNIIG